MWSHSQGCHSVSQCQMFDQQRMGLQSKMTRKKVLIHAATQTVNCIFCSTASMQIKDCSQSNISQYSFPSHTSRFIASFHTATESWSVRDWEQYYSYPSMAKTDRRLRSKALHVLYSTKFSWFKNFVDLPKLALK